MMTMTKRLCAAVSMGALLATTVASGLQAQQAYPNRPIEMVVTFGAGGGADLMGRHLAKLGEPVLNVAIPVSNISGASGNAGLTRVATNPADGYTLGTLIALSVASWAAGLGMAKPEDFKVVAVAQSSPSMLFVPKDSPHQTAKDLFEFAKKNPNAVRVATSGFGTMDDVTLRYLTGQQIPMTNVPFGKPAERYASTVGSHTTALYEEPGDVTQFIKSGDLKPILVFDDKRHESFPDVPTSTELGLDINGLDNFRTLVVRADTPPEVVDRLHQAFGEVLKSDEWQKFCEETYTCTENMPPDEAGRMVKDFHAKVQEFLQKQS